YRARPAIEPRVKLVPATAELGTVDPPLTRLCVFACGAFSQSRSAVGVEPHEVWTIRRRISVTHRLPRERSFHGLTRQEIGRGGRGIRTDIANPSCRQYQPHETSDLGVAHPRPL